MKKLFIGSGILLVLLVLMAFTGLTDARRPQKSSALTRETCNMPQATMTGYRII